MNGRERRRIVVGVDGSRNSLAALRWAVREAALRDDDVVAVQSYSAQLPAIAAMAPAPVVLSWPNEAAATGERLAEALREVFPDGAPATVTSRVEQGDAATVLVRVAADADLLVVGARGHSGLAELILGSVATACIRHASCPVVVVPAQAATVTALSRPRVAHA